MSDGVKMGSECEIVPPTGLGCDSVDWGRDFEAIGRAGGRKSEAAYRAGLVLRYDTEGTPMPPVTAAQTDLL